MSVEIAGAVRDLGVAVIGESGLIIDPADRVPEAGISACGASWASMPGAVIRTARPKQWLKNTLVLAAPASAGVLTNGRSLGRALVAFCLFSVVASGTYFLNDALDVHKDRVHPTKRFRPIAAGLIPPRVALLAGVALMGTAVAGGVVVAWKLGVVLALYIGLQFAYSLYLKHEPVYDLAAVASGFLLRAVAGAVAVGVSVSEWYLIVATFGSLLMVTGKRLGEYGELGEDRGSHRQSLAAYSPSFLRCVLAVASSGAIIGYCLWALSLSAQHGHHHSAFWCQVSIIPMFLALLKYAYLVESGAGAKPEELFLSDRSLQVLGAVWLAAFAAGVYAR